MGSMSCSLRIQYLHVGDKHLRNRNVSCYLEHNILIAKQLGLMIVKMTHVFSTASQNNDVHIFWLDLNLVMVTLWNAPWKHCSSMPLFIRCVTIGLWKVSCTQHRICNSHCSVIMWLLLGLMVLGYSVGYCLHAILGTYNSLVGIPCTLFLTLTFWILRPASRKYCKCMWLVIMC